MGYNTTSLVGFTGGRLNVGLSAVIALPVGDNQDTLFYQYVSGGTLYANGVSLAVATGFIAGATTQYNLQGYRGSLYFSSAGATSILSWYKLLT